MQDKVLEIDTCKVQHMYFVLVRTGRHWTNWQPLEREILAKSCLQAHSNLDAADADAVAVVVYRRDYKHCGVCFGMVPNHRGPPWVMLRLDY